MMQLFVRREWMKRVAVLGLCLVTTVVFAKQEKGSVTVRLPGVTKAGTLDDTLGADVTVNFSVNTETGKFTAHGDGKVKNLSKKTAKFKNIPVTIPDVNVKKSTYTVKKTGKCSVTASGVAAL